MLALVTSFVSKRLSQWGVWIGVAALAVFMAYSRGRNAEKRKTQKKRLKNLKAKADALEDSANTDIATIRERLRKRAGG